MTGHGLLTIINLPQFGVRGSIVLNAVFIHMIEPAAKDPGDERGCLWRCPPGRLLQLIMYRYCLSIYCKIQTSWKACGNGLITGYAHLENKSRNCSTYCLGYDKLNSPCFIFGATYNWLFGIVRHRISADFRSTAISFSPTMTRTFASVFLIPAFSL